LKHTNTVHDIHLLIYSRAHVADVYLTKKKIIL